VATCGKWSRLLKKRELLAYYILCRESGRIWNVGEAVDYLVENLLVTRKVASTITRRLRRLGLLVKEADLTYKCVGFEEYFRELLNNYVCKKRLKRST